MGGPVLAILFNLFAIMHMYTNNETHEFIITLKLKWVNIAIILLCGLILLFFFNLPGGGKCESSVNEFVKVSQMADDHKFILLAVLNGTSKDYARAIARTLCQGG